MGTKEEHTRVNRDIKCTPGKPGSLKSQSVHMERLEYLCVLICIVRVVLLHLLKKQASSFSHRAHAPLKIKPTLHRQLCFSTSKDHSCRLPICESRHSCHEVVPDFSNYLFFCYCIAFVNCPWKKLEFIVVFFIMSSFVILYLVIWQGLIITTVILVIASIKGVCIFLFRWFAIHVQSWPTLKIIYCCYLVLRNNVMMRHVLLKYWNLFYCVNVFITFENPSNYFCCFFMVKFSN